MVVEAVWKHIFSKKSQVHYRVGLIETKFPTTGTTAVTKVKLLRWCISRVRFNLIEHFDTWQPSEIE